ncbi:MAG: hypothetical protein WCK40_04295 [Thermoleophilia bacterium]
MSSVPGATAHLEASETAMVRDLREGYRRYRPSLVTLILGTLLLVALVYLYVDGFLMRAHGVDLAFVSLIGALGLLGFLLSLITSRPSRRPRAVDVTLGLFGALFAQVLTRELGVPVLVAVGVTGCTLGVLALPDGPLDFMASASGYAGMFTGLLQPGPVLAWGWVLIAGLLAGVLMSVVGPAVLPGVGARIGAVAFLAGSIVYLLAQWTGTDSPPLLPAESTGLASWAILPIGMAGALVTWVLIRRTSTPFVLASALPSLLVCGVMAIALPASLPVLGSAWLGGTLIASAGPERLPTAFWIGIAGVVYGALMLHFGGPLTGHVGVLGATATIACMATAAAEWLMHGRRLGSLVARIAPAPATPSR